MQPVEEKPEKSTTVTTTKDSIGNLTVSKAVEDKSADTGFDLLIGCVYVSDFKGLFVMADALLKGALEDVETVAGKPVSSIEHFELMQAVDALIPSIVKDLQGFTVISVMPSKGSAHARLIDGLRLHAKTIIQPLVS